MNFKQLFAAYYALYRNEAETPNSADDEYIIALALANEAIDRWSTYDNTYWKELFDNNLTADNASETTIAVGQAEYEAPTDMFMSGGFVRIKDDAGNTVRKYKIIEPQEAQFEGDKSTYCYFTGDPNNGYILHLNPGPDTAIDGHSIDYVYYKKPTLMTGDTSKPNMLKPYFMVHRMLANRFRGSRNPYYNTAKSDAEDVLRTMQSINNSGTWANPWSLSDHSGTTFGG